MQRECLDSNRDSSTARGVSSVGAGYAVGQADQADPSSCNVQME